MSCACGRNCVAMMQLVFYSIQTEFSWKDRADLNDHSFRTYSGRKLNIIISVMEVKIRETYYELALCVLYTGSHFKEED